MSRIYSGKRRKLPSRCFGVGIGDPPFIHRIKSGGPLSPPPSPVENSPFSPDAWVLDDSNAVLLSTRKLPSYLEKVLASLGLHLEARTSFIT